MGSRFIGVRPFDIDTMLCECMANMSFATGVYDVTDDDVTNDTQVYQVSPVESRKPEAREENPGMAKRRRVAAMNANTNNTGYTTPTEQVRPVRMPTTSSTPIQAGGIAPRPILEVVTVPRNAQPPAPVLVQPAVAVAPLPAPLLVQPAVAPPPAVAQQAPVNNNDLGDLATANLANGYFAARFATLFPDVNNNGGGASGN